MMSQLRVELQVLLAEVLEEGKERQRLWASLEEAQVRGQTDL